MGKLTCSCLNIKIIAKSNDLTPVDRKSLGFVPEDEFFSLDLAEVQLSLEGISVEHKSLVRTRASGEWTVSSCANCEMYTHAVHSTRGMSKILVNTSIKNDAAIVERLATSSDYSPLYKIVLHSRDDNHPIRTLGVQSGKYESLQQTLSDIQQQLNKFLMDEEAAMENRIREYEESQRAAYAELQSKARRDKNAMMSLVLAAEQTRISSDNSGPPSPIKTISKSSANPVKAAMPGANAGLAGTGNNPKVVKVMSGKKKLSSTSSDEHQDSRARKYASFDQRLSTSPTDADGVFDFEVGFQEDSNQPFYESDDDDQADTDDSSVSEDPMYPNRPKSFNYSASVPVSVPMWKMAASKKSFEEEVEDEEDFEAPADPDSMAASIKALARSVHADGTEMFGELPSKTTRTRARPTIQNYTASDFGQL